MNKEIETAIVTHYATGGSLLYLQQLADALQRTDYPVTFYLPQNNYAGIRNISRSKFLLKDPSAPPVRFSTKLLKYPYHLSKYLYNAFMLRPEQHIKVVHLLFPFYLTDWLTIERLKRRGIKVVLTVHEVRPHKAFLGGKIDKQLIRNIFGKADLLSVHSEALKDEVISEYSICPRQVRFIPHGYFEPHQNLSDVGSLKKKYHLPDAKVLLFFGVIRENKGLDTLLHATQKLSSDFFLIIAGETAGSSEIPVEYYQDIIETNNMGNSVYWMKRYITNEEVSELFAIADAIVLPYKKNFHSQSGVLNLAIGYEKPCVVSDVGGIGETVRGYDLGIVVEPENANALRDGIMKLFETPSTVYDFKKYKNENSWDIVAAKYVRLYEELLCA